MMQEAWKLFKESLNILKAHWKYALKTYVLISLLMFLILGVAGLVFALLYALLKSFAFLIFIAALIGFIVLIFWLAPVYLLIAKHLIAGEEVGLQTLFSEAKPFIVPLGWTSLVTGVITMLGFFLFIIPGLILAVWYMFTQFIVIEQKLSGFKAMGASKSLVKGRFWEAAWFISFVSLLSIVISFLSNIVEASPADIRLAGSLVVAAISFVISAAAPIYTYLVYRRFSSTPAKS